MSKRVAAVSRFNADPSHRRILRVVLAVVVLATVMCVASVWFFPTRYCNYIIPVVLGLSVTVLIIVSRGYASLVSGLLERHCLICEHCGCPTIPRPDEFSFRVSDRAFGTEVCYNCEVDLSDE